MPATRKLAPSAFGFDWSEVSTLALGEATGPRGAASKRSISGVGIEVPPPDAQIVEAVEQFSKAEGVLSVAAIDRALGRTLHATGAPLDEGLYLAVLHAISLAELSEGTVGEDLILTSSRRIFLARVIPARSGVAIFTVLEGDESNLGRARVLLKQAVASIT